MEIIRDVHCRVMKGLEPEWTDLTVTVGIDDIEPGTPDSEIIDMIQRDVRSQLISAGYLRYTIEIIESI